MNDHEFRLLHDDTGMEPTTRRRRLSRKRLALWFVAGNIAGLMLVAWLDHEPAPVYATGSGIRWSDDFRIVSGSDGALVIQNDTGSPTHKTGEDLVLYGADERWPEETDFKPLAGLCVDTVCRPWTGSSDWTFVKYTDGNIVMCIETVSGIATAHEADCVTPQKEPRVGAR